ncbi:MAG: hypothetical protein ACO4CW_01210 [Planctomycetota bacterium]
MSDTLLWIALGTMLLWGIGALRLDLLQRRLGKLICFPGLLLEAGIRVIACLVTATPIGGVRPFEAGSPFLTTGRCPVRRIGAPISLAIRLVLTFSVAILVAHLGLPKLAESGLDLPTIITGGDPLGETLGAWVTGLPSAIGSIGWGSPLTLFTLYLLFTFSLASGINRRELLAALWGWGGLLALATSLTWLGVRFSFLSRGWFIERFLLPGVWSGFSLFILLGVLTLLLLVAFHQAPPIAAAVKPRGGETPQTSADEVR